MVEEDTPFAAERDVFVLNKEMQMNFIGERVFNEPIEWKRSGDPGFPYYADVNGQQWKIKVNDFPEDDLYTLMIGQKSVNFNDWPVAWERASRPLLHTTHHRGTEVLRKHCFALPLYPDLEEHEVVTVVTNLRDAALSCSS